MEVAHDLCCLSSLAEKIGRNLSGGSGAGLGSRACSGPILEDIVERHSLGKIVCTQADDSTGEWLRDENGYDHGEDDDDGGGEEGEYEKGAEEEGDDPYDGQDGNDWDDDGRQGHDSVCVCVRVCVKGDARCNEAEQGRK